MDPEFTKAEVDQELMKDWCSSTYTHHVGTCPCTTFANARFPRIFESWCGASPHGAPQLHPCDLQIFRPFSPVFVLPSGTLNFAADGSIIYGAGDGSHFQGLGTSAHLIFHASSHNSEAGVGVVAMRAKGARRKPREGPEKEGEGGGRSCGVTTEGAGQLWREELLTTQYYFYDARCLCAAFPCPDVRFDVLVAPVCVW